MSKRLTVRLSDDDHERLAYWADRRNMSVNAYLALAIDVMIRRENHDYDVPEAQIARINQLVDVVESLSQNVASLEQVTVSGFESLLGLTRGDNYLLEE